ncbi:MAG: hypothetical protein ACOZAN_01055 [Patescibacteria group bacterium]
MVEITVKVARSTVWRMDANTIYEYAQGFVVGDVEKDELGKKTSKIKKVSVLPVSADEYSLYLTLEVPANYDPRKNLYYLKGKPLVFGQEYLFSFSNVSFSSVVVDFPGLEKSESGKKVTVEAMLLNDDWHSDRVDGVHDFLANAVQKDQVIIDSDGNQIVRVKNVRISPSIRQNSNQFGQLVVVQDASLKSVVYELELSVDQNNGRYFLYHNVPVLIGQELPLNFSNVSIAPVVTRFISEE